MSAIPAKYTCILSGMRPAPQACLAFGRKGGFPILSLIISHCIFIMLRYVKNLVSMATMSHENCGLDYSPMNQMKHSDITKKLANEIDVSDQSEEGLNQYKGNRKNTFSMCD